MRAKFWRCPTAVSKKLSFKFISRWHWFLSSHCLTNYGVFRFVRSLLRNNCCTANCDFERCLCGTNKHILNCYRLWQEQTVALLPAPDGSGYTYNATMQKMLLYMRTTVKQQNVMRFFGVTTIKGVLFSVSEYCSKGVLRDILEVIQTRGFYICYVYILLFFICLYYNYEHFISTFIYFIIKFTMSSSIKLLWMLAIIRYVSP